MPRSAIATGLADLVLPIREIALRLPELIRNRTSVAVGSDERSRRRVDATDSLAPARPHGTRFLQLQEIDDPPPHRAPHAGAASADDGRLPYGPARKRGGGAGAVRRSPDLGHDILSRPTGLRQAGGARHSDAVRRQGRGRRDSRLGPRLRHRRGSLFDRHPAARRGGESRDPGAKSRSSPPISTRRALAVGARGSLPARHRSRHDTKTGCGDFSAKRSITTGSPANCATSCCSPGTAFSRTRRSRAPISSPAATC